MKESEKKTKLEYVKFPQTSAINHLYYRHFSRKGYSFLGWNTKKDGTGDWYANGAAIATDPDNDVTEINEPLNLYAQWDNTKDEKEGVTYKYTPAPFAGTSGFSDTTDLPIDTAWKKQTLIAIDGVFKPQVYTITSTDDGSQTVYARLSAIITLWGTAPDGSTTAAQVAFHYKRVSDTELAFYAKILLGIGGEMYGKRYFEMDIGDKFRCDLRVDKHRITLNFINDTKGTQYSVSKPAELTAIEILNVQDGLAPSTISNETARQYTVQYNSVDVFQDGKHVSHFKPITMLADYTFQNNLTGYTGKSGFVDTITDKFYLNPLIKGSYEVEDGWLTVYKPDDVSSVNMTYENNGFSILYNADFGGTVNMERTSAGRIKLTATLDSSNPYIKLRAGQGTQDDTNYAFFTFSDKVELHGKLSAMNNAITTLDKEYQFYRMFADQPIVTAPEIDITNTTKWCLNETFAGCTELLEAPAITVDKIVMSACAGTFMDCTKLEKAGKITTSEIEQYGCNDMYSSCTSLRAMPDMTSITKVGYGGCSAMFSDCEVMKVQNLMPSGELSEHWGDYMLDNAGIKELDTVVTEIEGGKEIDMEDTDVEKVNLWNDSIATSN